MGVHNMELNPLYADRATNEPRSHPSAASDVAGAGAQDDKAVMAEDDNTQRHPSPPRPRSNSDEKAITMEDKVGEYTAVNPFETDAHGEVALHYHKIQGLQDKHLDALTKMDIDGNGTVSLSEMLTMEKSNRSLKQTVCYLAIALLLLIGTLFAVSWAAAVLAQDTKLSGDGHTMVAAAHLKEIVTTAEAKESVPAAFASLLSPDQLGRVKDITLVKFTEVDRDRSEDSGFTFMGNDTIDIFDNSTVVNSTLVFELPTRMTAQVQFIQEFNDTYIKFYCMGGITVAIDHGGIHVTGLPQSPETTFLACGSAKCSSIHVDEVDVPALKRRASQLGFVDTAGGDSTARRNAMRRTGSSGSCGSTSDLCNDNQRITGSDDWSKCGRFLFWGHFNMHTTPDKYCACDTGYQWDSNKCAKCPSSPVGKCFDMTKRFGDEWWAATDKDKSVIFSFTPDETIFNFAWTSEIRPTSCSGCGYSLRTCTKKCSRSIDYYTPTQVFWAGGSSCKSTCSDLTTSHVAKMKGGPYWGPYSSLTYRGIPSEDIYLDQQGLSVSCSEISKQGDMTLSGDESYNYRL